MFYKIKHLFLSRYYACGIMGSSGFSIEGSEFSLSSDDIVNRRFTFQMECLAHVKMLEKADQVMEKR